MKKRVYYLKNMLFLFNLIICCLGCSRNNQNNYLIKVYQGDIDEIGVQCAYVNHKGDTIIPFGKYHYCYTDTFKKYAIVLKNNGKCVAIDKNEKELFEVFWFDNGPDYIKDGLFRIVENRKIGYANEVGQVVIKPQFKFAFPFKSGKAKVTLEGKLIKDGEHSYWKSDHWFFIDKKGAIVK